MEYEFDKTIPRQDTFSYKWDGCAMVFPGCPGVLPLWVADTDFPCPVEIVKAIQNRANHPIYGYAHVDENNLKNLAASWQRERNQFKIDTSSITFSNGVIPAICTAIQAFTKPNDGVIVQVPVYYPFMDCIKNNNRVVVENPLLYDGERWKMDLQGFEKLASRSSTKLFILCNPHNPVGLVFSKEELQAVGSICVKHNVYIVSDEVHSDIIFPGARHIPIASIQRDISDITMTAFSPSKTFNVAGLQASVIVIENPDMLFAFEQEMQRDYFRMNLFGVVALEAAYSGCEGYLEQLIDYLWQNYLFVKQYLEKHTPLIKCIRPEATYLLWLDCSALGLDVRALDHFFLKEAKVALDSGHWFGKPGESFMRLNIGCPRTTLQRCMQQIKEAYKRAGY